MRNDQEEYLPIAAYGVIGNLHSTALVGGNGSIDWCCLPEMDSPSIFGALLDRRRGGRFRVGVRRPRRWDQRYIEGTNVLETVLEGKGGRLRATDFMPLSEPLNGRSPGDEPAPEIHRLLFCESGEVDVEVEWSPRFGYARARTRIDAVDGAFAALAGGEQMVLRGLGPAEAEIRDDGYGPVVLGSFRLSAGESRALVSRFGTTRVDHDVDTTRRALRQTVQAWRDWTHVCRPPGECAFAGPLHHRVARAGLLLKLLTHRHTGAIAAAPTTSLPEEIGGVRNWDYRFSWIRDSSLVAQALSALGHRQEACEFLEWVEQVSEATGEHGYDLQIMYGLHGERDLPEIQLDHLEGYRGSRPVRVGNAAAGQLQLDIFGELIGAAYELVRMGGRLHPALWRFLCAVADEVCRRWREPDHGIWEVRSEPRHFTFSKVMAWVALDRAIRLSDRFGLPARTHAWRRERAAIHRAVLTHGFDPASGSFVRSFGSRALDASNLLLPIVEFLAPDDPRVQGTIDRTLEELTENGMVRRYRADDGLPGGEGTFTLCTFWLADALTVSGRLAEARDTFQGMVERGNHLGLYPEEIDARTGEFLGNYPQAFSHAGFINSALYLARAEGRRAPGPAPMGSREHRAEAAE